MANYDFSHLTMWGGELWIYNIPTNGESDINGGTVGDTFTILPKDGGYPLVDGIPDFNEAVRWRPGTYNVANVVSGYGGPDGNRNMLRLDSMPLENASGVQIGHFSNPYISGGLGYLNAPGFVPLVTGSLTFVSRSGNTVTLNESGSSGAAGFTKKLHRTSTPTDTPSAETVVATGDGPYTITAPDNNLYYYFVEYKDNITTSGKTSNICAASTVDTQLPALPAAKTDAPPKIAIIGVGDSNVQYGCFDDVTSLLETIDSRHNATYVNRGVGGTRAQWWLDQSNLYQPALDSISAAISANRKPVVIQMLGTNDGVLDSVPAATYGASMATLAQKWLDAGAEYVILMQPAYSIPRRFNNSSNSLLALMLQYHTQLASIAASNPKIVYVPGLYRYFADHQDIITDGVHFGNQTAGQLAASTYAAVAIANTIPGVASGGGGITIEQITAAVAATLTSQGYTAARAAKLDRLDAPVSTIPASVWNTPINDKNADELFAIIAGLVGHNAKVQNVTTNSSGAITSATIKLFANSDEAETDGESFAEYQTTASYDGAKLISESTVRSQ